MSGTERATVAVVSCGSYERREVGAAVSRAVDLIGGIGRFVRPGERILLKPNLLSAKAPERAITTHPEVARAVIRLVRDAGAEPEMGDSPGGAIRGVERVWRNTGFEELAEETEVALRSFEASGSEERTGALRPYMVARPVLEADGIINLPKMKTHVLTLYTGAVKNMYGIVPGFMKGRLHSVAPRPVPFSRIVVDIFSLRPPRLHVMDAVAAMEGDGPSGGSRRHVGAILASADPVALDAVASGMMGYRERQVPTVRIGEERGLGVAGLDRIDIVGDDAEKLAPEDFRLPGTGALNYIPDILVRLLEPFIWAHPEMSPERGCRGPECGLCVRSCPVRAIRLVDGVPTVDFKTCVECLCCHEVCPHDAVEVKLSWLAGRFA
ncbi:MAG: DUF362 domain-containing protein [Candidatus Eisenbacteria bacterium]|nr:DUF362 domain-containing protein [Candidatus Eisenbacteria bacterium]